MPYTVAIPMHRSAPDVTLFEYACHEGNHAMVNLLNAGRANEQQAIDAARLVSAAADRGRPPRRAGAGGAVRTDSGPGPVVRRRARMIVPTIFDTCRPRADVLRGAVAEADFAADLAQVVTGHGSPEYVDPARFFANTWPTRGLKNLLANVCRRLSGAGGEAAAIFRLDTSYGGGKTHGLIALAHAARGLAGVGGVNEFIDPALLPRGPVRLAAFDGENADPANGRTMGEGVRAHTPWGELAYALAGTAGYERVRNSDASGVAPGADTLRELFGGEPTLILLDELSVYLRKVQQTGAARDQLTAFLTSLFKAVEGAPRAALVYTLAIGKQGRAVDAYSVENQFIADRMAEAESVSARKATLLNPTEEDETAQVLRRRLFESVDVGAAREAVAAYQAVWSAKRDSLADDAIRPETAESFRASYPLHPEVLQTLTSKTATLETFQRVRGMLRLLARTIARLWETHPADATAIHLHHVDPGYEPIRQEIVTRLQQSAYVPAIANDVAGSGGARGAGGGARREAPRRSAPLRHLHRAHRLHAHARVQRAAQGRVAGAVALFRPGADVGGELHRGGAEEVHPRVRLSRRPPGRSDALPRGGQPHADHPPRGEERRLRRRPHRAERPDRADLPGRDVRRHPFPGRTLRRAGRRGRAGGRSWWCWPTTP